MSQIVTISLNEAGLTALKKAKEKNPEFNFSGFVNAALLKIPTEQTIEDLKYTLLYKKNYIEQLRLEIDLMESKIKELNEKEITKEEEAKETEVRKQKNAKWRYNNFIDNCQIFFGLTDIQAVEELYQEYDKESLSVFEFMQNKGYKRVDNA